VTDRSKTSVGHLSEKNVAPSSYRRLLRCRMNRKLPAQNPQMFWRFSYGRTNNHQVVLDQNGNAESPLKDMVTGQRTTGEALAPELLNYRRGSFFSSAG
jgi:hypothetical protein